MDKLKKKHLKNNTIKTAFRLLAVSCGKRGGERESESKKKRFYRYWHHQKLLFLFESYKAK